MSKPRENKTKKYSTAINTFRGHKQQHFYLDFSKVRF